MCELKKNGKVFTSKFVGTGPSSYEKRIYRAAVSQRLRNTGLNHIGRTSQRTPNTSITMLVQLNMFRIVSLRYSQEKKK